MNAKPTILNHLGSSLKLIVTNEKFQETIKGDLGGLKKGLKSFCLVIFAVLGCILLSPLAPFAISTTKRLFDKLLYSKYDTFFASIATAVTVFGLIFGIYFIVFSAMHGYFVLLMMLMVITNTLSYLHTAWIRANSSH